MHEKDEQPGTIQYPKNSAEKNKWEYGHVIHSCSGTDEAHDDDCPGDCEDKVATDTHVDLHNEAEQWTMRGMIIQGVPAPLVGGPFPGIRVEIFELECRFAGLIKYLDEYFGEDWFDKEKASECYQQVMLEKLQNIRKNVEAAETPQLAVAKTKLLGPDGNEILH